MIIELNFSQYYIIVILKKVVLKQLTIDKFQHSQMWNVYVSKHSMILNNVKFTMVV